MRFLPAAVFFAACGVGAWAADAVIVAGMHLGDLVVGPVTYHQVVVRSVNARTLVITYTGGMTSIRLRELPPELQQRFHYNPAAEAAADLADATPAPRPAATVHLLAKKKATGFDALLQQFGHPAEVRSEIDLRAKFMQLELGVKNQGRRPSCAIFAVVSALEFENAEQTGRAQKFSEEYLIWAARKTVQRLPPPGATDGQPVEEDADEGFALSEVVEALRAYGIPLQSTMPNTFGSKINAIEDPSPAIIEEARNHQRVFVHRLPGRDPATLINNLVQALNAGVPIPIGMAWPGWRAVRSGYLAGQKPEGGGGHAVTLVGYKCPTGRIEDAVFTFKNSWGPQWGQGGYGEVTYGYLASYLDEAIVLEVQSG